MKSAQAVRRCERLTTILGNMITILNRRAASMRSGVNAGYPSTQARTSRSTKPSPSMWIVQAEGRADPVTSVRSRLLARPR